MAYVNIKNLEPVAPSAYRFGPSGLAVLSPVWYEFKVL